MSAASGRPRRRQNPFVFAAETNSRFALLVFTSVVIILYMGLLLGTELVDPPPLFEAPSSDLPFDEYAEKVVSQLEPQVLYFGTETAILAGLAGATLYLARVIYRRHPQHIRRKKNLRPLEPGKDTRFDQAYAELVAISGIAPPPSVETAEDSRLTDGQAFGVKNRYSLRLGGRMRLLLRKSPGMFAAVVLHELAHIANGDIGRAYFTQALWAAVLAIAIVPAVLAVTGQFLTGLTGRVLEILRGTGFDFARFFLVNLPVTLLILLQLGTLVILLAAIRASVLRTRELYADWRAALWGAEAGLDAIFAGQEQSKMGWWQRVWQLHPSPLQRRNTLHDPARLFKLSPDIPLFVGMLVAITLPAVAWLASQIGLVVNALFLIAGILLAGGATSGDYGLLGSLSAAVLTLFFVTLFLFIVGPLFSVGYLTASAVGLQLQRSTLYDLTLDSHPGCISYLGLAGYALLMAVGFLMGSLMVPVNVLVPIASIFGGALTVNQLIVIPLETMLWLVVASFAHWLWMAQLRYLSARLLGIHTGYKPPRGKRQLLSVMMGLLLGLAYIPIVILLIWVFRNLNGLASIIPFETIALVVVGSLAMYVVVALLTSGLVEVWVRLASHRCPQCGTGAPAAISVGKRCARCGSDLSPWVFADPPDYRDATIVVQRQAD